MAYEYLTQFTSPYGPATSAKKTSITIHHWGAYGQTFQNVINFLCSYREKPTSAHYVAVAGRVACIVDPDRAAYHCGVNAGNTGSIGIECRPEATDGDYETVAELIRDLRRVYGDIPLKRHSDWKATACPGKWDLARLDRLARATPIQPPKTEPEKPVIPEETNMRLIQAADRGIALVGINEFKGLSIEQVYALQRSGVPGPATLTGADFDLVRAVCEADAGETVLHAGIEKLLERPAADVDEAALAAALAPLLSQVNEKELTEAVQTAVARLKGVVTFE